MSAAYVISLGYDERFAMRFLLRHSVMEENVVMAIVPRGYEGDEKARTAVNNLRRLVEWMEVVEFDIDDPLKGIVELFSLMKKRMASSERVYLCLSGGMRLIVISTLLAAQQLIKEAAKEVWVEIDLENLSGTSTIPLNAFLIPRNERFLKILNALMKTERPSIRYVEKETSIPLSTAHREMKRMVSLGLLTEEFRITDIGRAYLVLHSRA